MTPIVFAMTIVGWGLLGKQGLLVSESIRRIDHSISIELVVGAEVDAIQCHRHRDGHRLTDRRRRYATFDRLYRCLNRCIHDVRNLRSK